MIRTDGIQTIANAESVVLCAECGTEHYVFADGSSLCALCYVHGVSRAKVLARKIERQGVKRVVRTVPYNEFHESLR